MNSSDPQGDVLRDSSAPAYRELQSEHERLRYLFVLSLASFVLLSLAACGFMGQQWRIAKWQASQQQTAVQNLWRDYKGTQSKIGDFVKALQTYAAQNREFQPILEKYRRSLGDYFKPTSAAPAPAAAPSAAPAPK
jgi:type II secretory pathway component PulL